MARSVAINSLEIKLILQPTRCDVKIGPDRTDENKLIEYCSLN